MTGQLVPDFPRVKSDLLAAKEEHNEDFDSVMIYNSNFVPHITRDVYSEGYVLDNKDACEVKEEILLLIIVISAPEHFAHREAIRSSWGRHRCHDEDACSSSAIAIGEAFGDEVL